MSKKSILSLILAMMIMLAAVPFSVSAAATDSLAEAGKAAKIASEMATVKQNGKADIEASGTAYIKNIECTVKIPVVGNNASTSSIVADDSQCTSQVLYWYEWGGDYTHLTGNDTFEAGKMYCVRIQFDPKSGYAFDSDNMGSINITINDKKADWAGGHVWQAYFTPLPQIPDTVISQIDCSVTTPVVGSTPASTVSVTSESHCTVKIEYWYQVGNGYPHLSNGEKFEEDKTYAVRISVTPESGYKLPSGEARSSLVKINGKKASWSGGNEWFLNFKPLQPFSQISFSAQTPAEGDNPSGDVQIYPAKAANMFTASASWRNLTDDKSMSDTDTFEAEKEYRLMITFVPTDGYSTYNPDIIKDTVFFVNDEEQPSENLIWFLAYGLTRSGTYTIEKTETFVFVDTLDCTLAVPFAGHGCAEAVQPAEPDKYDVTAQTWIDSENPSNDMKSGSIFKAENKYTLNVSFMPKPGYKFSDTITANINGEKADSATLNSDKTELTLTKSFIAEGELIKSLDITIPVPEDGKPVGSFYSSDVGEKVIVNVTDWIKDDISMSHDDTFVGGEEYVAYVEIESLEGYTLDKSAAVRINGKDSVQDGDKPSYKIALTAAKNGSDTVYKVGDVNGDGDVNGADSGILMRYASGWEGYDTKIVNMDAADINRDGNVNGADAGLLARYISGWEGYDKYIIEISK